MNAEGIVDDLEQVPRFAAEAVGGALLIGLVLGTLIIGYFLIRRRSLSASGPSLTCGYRELGKQRWRSTFIRMGVTTLDCYRVFGFGLRPLQSWRRGDLDMSTPVEATGMVPGITDPIAVRLRLPHSAEEFELAIERSAYPALRSWCESGPPRPNSVV
ncbi:MAG TPA: DUF2550 family protein [Intrasporangiaceae bacterium]|nr:DUF2550 family protein [Intrasporangiaceae bacterium]